MSELLEAFVTESGTTWKKVRGKDNNIYHFRDGTFKSEHAFKSVPNQSIKQYGENVKVAVPSDTGPGYKRIEVSQMDASALGQDLAYYSNLKQGKSTIQPARDTITLAGETYRIETLANLNERIIDTYENENLVMVY